MLRWLRDRLRQRREGSGRFREIGDVFLENFAVADDGIERRAQLVAHIGEELRLVLAGDLELAALVVDFVEQPRILNRQNRVRSESLDQASSRFP